MYDENQPKTQFPNPPSLITKTRKSLQAKVGGFGRIEKICVKKDFFQIE